MEKKLMTVKELAEYLSLPVRRIYIWKSEGKIPYVKLGGRLLFDRQEIDEWIEKNKNK